MLKYNVHVYNVHVYQRISINMFAFYPDLNSSLTLNLPITTIVLYAKNIDSVETPNNSVFHSNHSCLTRGQ